MDISIKYQIIERVIQSNDEVLLDQIMHILDSPNTETIPSEIQMAIQKAEEELEEGKGISHEEVMNEINARF